jgi:RNA polymerase sigma factor (sigma-70 family)
MSPREIAKLVDTHAPALLLYARQFCAVAEDVVQEALLKLVSQRQPPRDLAAWLYRVVRNAALDTATAQRRRTRREQVVARSARWFSEPDVDGLDAEQAESAMKELPVEQRETIVAHLWGGLTFAQIAEVAGTSVSTAFRRYEAGIAGLRERLGVACPKNPT